MNRHFSVWTIVLLVICCVCVLPWTPLWNVVLDVGYKPLCLFGVDHWFSAEETLVLSDGTGADLSGANDPARQKEVERAEWLCGKYRFSSDFMLWVRVFRLWRPAMEETVREKILSLTKEEPKARKVLVW